MMASYHYAFSYPFLPGHLASLRLNPGLILRTAADIGAIWVAILFACLLTGGSDFTTRAIQDTGPTSVLLATLLSVFVLTAYAAAGLYTSLRGSPLSMKIGRIIYVNLALLMIAGVASLLASEPMALPLNLLLTAFLASTGLLCLARTVSHVLRSDYRKESQSDPSAQADESTVLVIGGAGYVGSALVERLLNQNLKVSVLDAMHFGEQALSRVLGHPNLTLIREDFRHIEVLTRAMSGVGSVIHLGGLVGDPACAVDPDLTVDVNVTATKLVGEIAKARGVRRFIFASSCSVYGACDEIVNEDSRFNPQSLYGRSKVASEVVLGALNCRDFAVTRLRFATIYGISGRTRFDLVVNLLCAKAVREGVITVFGADQWRPFVHVDDVAKAIVMTLQAPIELVAGEAFNVGSDDQNYTLGKMAELVQRQVRDADIISDDSCVDRRNYHVSFKKIRSRIGFTPSWSLERGIAQVILRVRSNEVGHHSLPTYSNVLYLKSRGTQSFRAYKITGWENELMEVDRIASRKTASQPVAA
jgi:nucleoside-diphosphate-sugar epimerase